ncbi:MAG TPA: hypothetical protein ENH55_15280 [Aurantimonas coralicida]|uniref:Uncharacterized protein n=2 Tax=root TaxID=1 RepID=A0A9C9NJ18_9HYPH|nr:hypothetical protein [Aurantimonas coralicida]HEU02622.1 hypothetical protein [Aurantimonas coralicida]
MENLKTAFAYHRAFKLRAHRAIELAREDVANGTARYPGSEIWPAVTWHDNGDANILNSDAAGLRLVGHADEIATLGHTGWLTTPDGETSKDDTGRCRGVVYQLPGRKGASRFVGGYQFGGTDAGPTLDLTTIFEEPATRHIPASNGWRAYWDWNDNPRKSEAARDAAMMADSMAQHAAEDERDWQTAWQAGSRAADLDLQITEQRNEIRDALTARKGIRKSLTRFGVPLDGDEWRKACGFIHDKVRACLSNIHDLRNERDELADSIPSALMVAFNEGRG